MSHLCIYRGWIGLSSVRGSGQVLQRQRSLWGPCNSVWWRPQKQHIKYRKGCRFCGNLVGVGVGKLRAEVSWSRGKLESNWEERHSGKKAQQRQRQGDRKVSVVFRDVLKVQASRGV